jgi:hypothetical protein
MSVWGVRTGPNIGVPKTFLDLAYSYSTSIEIESENRSAKSGYNSLVPIDSLCEMGNLSQNYTNDGQVLLYPGCVDYPLAGLVVLSS